MHMTNRSLLTSNRRAQTLYSFIHILYWINNGFLFSFASVYLQSYGFTTGHIGLVLGLAYTLSAFLQPAIVAVMERFAIRLNTGLVGVYLIIAALAVSLLALPLSNAAVAVVMIAALALQSAALPNISSLAHAVEAYDLKVDFSSARALGSVGYAIFTSIMGRALNHFSPRLLPGMYLLTLLAMAALLSLMRTPACTRQEKQKGSGSFLKDSVPFVLFLVGVLSICLNHTLIDAFMLQIMQNIGGGSAELGVAVAIAAMLEVPVMLFYSRIRKALGLRNILILCGWAWFVKNALTAFAVSPVMIYAAQTLQALGYALYVPLTIDLVIKLLPEKDFLRGQALAGSAFTFGGLFATFAGGVTLDALGVSNALKLMVIFSLIGAVLFTLTALSAPFKKK